MERVVRQEAIHSVNLVALLDAITHKMSKIKIVKN